MSDVFRPDNAAHQKALSLLQERIIAWFTTVDAEGRPRAVPVWFFWHEGKIFVFSAPDKAKVANVRRGSPVLIHLDSGPFGSEVVILNGTAEISDRDTATWVTDFGDAYDRKYAEAIAHSGRPRDELLAAFPLAIIFTPETLQTW